MSACPVCALYIGGNSFVTAWLKNTANRLFATSLGVRWIELVACTHMNVLTCGIACLFTQKGTRQSQGIFIASYSTLLIWIVSTRPIRVNVVIKVWRSFIAIDELIVSGLSSPVHKIHSCILAYAKRILGKIFLIIATAHSSFPKVICILV